MSKKDFIKLITDITGKEYFRLDEPMSLHTTFKIGGPADIFVTPPNQLMLIRLLRVIQENGIPYFIIGKGSNLVVSDKGIRGLVICTDDIKYIKIKGNLIYASCGVEMAELCSFAATLGLSGLEFACGIPGTVGGAVYMNAGAYESEISQVLAFSKVFNLKTSLSRTFTNKEHRFSYRHSFLQEEPFIHLNSTFNLIPTDKGAIYSKMNELTKSREDKQPLELPSAGSVFRRPEGFFTGKLIEECGLRGYRIGDAAISTKHCGFIVNLGNATAKDIKDLIQHIQKTIFDKHGVMLQTEIKFVGAE